MRRIGYLSSVLILCFYTSVVFSLTFHQHPGSDIIGKLQYTTVQKGESLGDIGRRFDMGLYEMIEANPTVNPWVPKPGVKVVIPSQFILPSGPREGIVLNLAEMRLYYYHPHKELVTTHPISIGRKGWETPLGNTTIIEKVKDPDWHPPKSIQEYYLKKGTFLPEVIKAGPANPLGAYMLRLGLAGYLIHGTNRPAGVGVRVSSGCIRLMPEDIASLFYKVSVGTKVRIIHEPLKLGWDQDNLYLEVHEPLSEEYYVGHTDPDQIKAILQEKAPNRIGQWDEILEKAKKTVGYPVVIH